MRKESLLPLLLLLSLIGTLVGAFFKIRHQPGGDLGLLLGLACSLAYWFIAFYDVMRARYLPIPERLMWVIGLLAVPYVAGWLYYFAWKRGRFAR